MGEKQTSKKHCGLLFIVRKVIQNKEILVLNSTYKWSLVLWNGSASGFLLHCFMAVVAFAQTWQWISKGYLEPLVSCDPYRKRSSSGSHDITPVVFAFQDSLIGGKRLLES